MINKNRTYKIIEIPDNKLLAVSLIKNKYIFNAGFEYKGYLFLNDTSTHEIYGRYALIKKNTLIQIYSVFIAQNEQKLLESFITILVYGDFDDNNLDTVNKENLIF